VKEGGDFPAPTLRQIRERRSSTGGVGNPALPALRRRLAAARRWAGAERRRFSNAMAKLAGKAR
jgi:hypothetical protein